MLAINGKLISQLVSEGEEGGEGVPPLARIAINGQPRSEVASIPLEVRVAELVAVAVGSEVRLTLESSVLMTGHMHKKGEHGLKTWQRRFFVLVWWDAPAHRHTRHRHALPHPPSPRVTAPAHCRESHAPPRVTRRAAVDLAGARSTWRSARSATMRGGTTARAGSRERSS